MVQNFPAKDPGQGREWECWYCGLTERVFLHVCSKCGMSRDIRETAEDIKNASHEATGRLMRGQGLTDKDVEILRAPLPPPYAPIKKFEGGTYREPPKVVSDPKALLNTGEHVEDAERRKLKKPAPLDWLDMAIARFDAMMAWGLVSAAAVSLFFAALKGGEAWSIALTACFGAFTTYQVARTFMQLRQAYKNYLAEGRR